jgi:hypothetical protein
MEPDPRIKQLIRSVAFRRAVADSMTVMMERANEFPSETEAKLTGLALDPRSREYADSFLDSLWENESPLNGEDEDTEYDEVIIGSGYHAAVYCATRVLSGFPKPLVLERNNRAGGSFAVSKRPTFYLNSRNRAGMGGYAGDRGASLNYLPGAPIQAANVSMREYQANDEMAFVIRLALAQFAEVETNATVASVSTSFGTGRIRVTLDDGRTVTTKRLIDARGLGDPKDSPIANGKTLVTFPQFLQRMESNWPLRGLKRVAIVGNGDSAKCAVESLIGIAPQPFMGAAALDSIDRIDWYAQDTPIDCESWRDRIRGRYQSIGPFLRSDRFGERPLNVVQRQANPIALPTGTVLINGRNYTLTIMCTGYRENRIDGLEDFNYGAYAVASEAVATRDTANDVEIYRIGPHANLSFTQRERADDIDRIDANRVAMFRLGPKTAALAATLPKP